MATKILHKSLLRTSILAAASLAFSLEAMAAEVTRDGIKYSLDETTFKATVMKNSCYEGVLELPATVSDDSGQQYTVVGIGKDAFLYCEKLTGIVAPNTVTDIGESAFDCCYELTEVYFPNVTSVGNYAFYDCYDLTEVSFPKATSIGEFAFFNCESLAEVSFPNVTSIEEEVFHGCSNLTSVSFPNVTIIGSDAFSDCPIETITLDQPDPSKVDAYVYIDFGMLSNITLYVPAEALSLYKENEAWSALGFKSIEQINEFVADGIVYTRIGKDSVEVAAGNCYEGELELPATVSDESGKQYTVAGIGKHAFNGCEKLTYIEIPNTVTYIGEEAFQETGLSSVVVPASVTKMGAQPFHFCKNLKVAEILGPVDSLNCTFSECEALKFVTLPGSLKVFGSYAFFNCKSLESITMKQYDPSSLIIKDGTSFGTNKEYEMLNGTKLLVPEGTLDDYANSSFGKLFKDIQEYMPSYKAKIYYNGREYMQGYVSMDKKYSFNYIAVVEEYIYDPNFDLTQSENVIWLTGENQYVANSIRLVDNSPVYFSVGFLANEISYTRTPSIYNEKVEGETGWETLYLPFTATTVTAGGASITPFNYGGKEKTAENISAGNDFWAKEPVMDNENTLYFSHISDAKFEAGMPYLISFPGDGFGKYSLKDQEIVFSNANVNVAATDDLTAGVNCGQYTMAGTGMGLSSSEAEDYYLFDVENNVFQKKVGEGVVPFRCYVQKTPSEEGSSSLRSGHGNVVFAGSYEDYMAQQKGNTTLQTDANADQVIIYAQEKNIILVASESGDATISNLNGQVIKSVNYQEGLNNLGEFAQGVYLINGVKVIVK